MAVTIQRIATECGGELHLRQGDADIEISHIAINGADARPDGIFAAVAGTRSHGAKFAGTSPAAAIVTDKAGYEILKTAGETRPVLVFDDLRAHLGPVSSLICGHPSKDMTVIGITGTSGKTTTSYMVEAGLTAAGAVVGLIGTTGTRIAGTPVPTSLTTPEAPTLQELFVQMRDKGVTHVVMEVSSHAIALGRVGGVDFDVALFTNLSQDHLDFHPTMEDYFQTKARLFKEDSPLHAETAVVCIDDAWGQRLATMLPHPFTVSTEAASEHDASLQPDVWAGPSSVMDNGVQTAELYGFGANEMTLHIPMPGRFNVANAMLAMGLLVKTGMKAEDAIEGLSTVTVPGRLERIDCGQDYMAVVDYAHKPGAIAAVLDTLRAHVRGRIAIVVGAGGDRDHSKRPIMGREAALRSDLVIVTDDNPRSEDPASIRQQVVAGAQEVADHASVDRADEPHNKVKTEGSEHRPTIREIGDRREAIRAAIQWAQPGDAVIVAGKGHETGQLIGDTTHPFDDRVETRRSIDDKLNSSVEK